MLLKLISTILPHLGGQSLDVVEEIAQITIKSGKTSNSLYLEFTLLKYKLEMSGHLIPATAMIQHYLNMIMNIIQAKMHIASIQRDFKDHLQSYGPDVEFTLIIEYVQNFMECLLIDMDKDITLVSNGNSKYFALACGVLPIERAAIGHRNVDKESPSCNLILDRFPWSVLEKEHSAPFATKCTTSMNALIVVTNGNQNG